MQILGYNIRIQKKREAENVRMKDRNHLHFQLKVAGFCYCQLSKVEACPSSSSGELCSDRCLVGMGMFWAIPPVCFLLPQGITGISSNKTPKISCRNRFSLACSISEGSASTLCLGCLSFGAFWKGLTFFSVARLRWLLLLAVSYSLQSRGMCNHRVQLQSMTLGQYGTSWQPFVYPPFSGPPSSGSSKNMDLFFFMSRSLRD